MSDPKPVIFLAFANDRQDEARYLRGLSRELRALRAALGPARQAGVVELVERANATLADILDVFQDPAYSGRIKVFHYGGHANSYQLLLESAEGGPELANSKGLSRFLSNQDNLELVFLNGCSTEQQAQDLLGAGIPVTITTSQDINDDTALRFARRFYNGIGGYATINKSFNDAQAEIATLTSGDNLRGLYWAEKESSDVQATFPWKVLPEAGSEWKLRAPASPQGQSIDVSNLKVGDFAHVLINRYEQDSEFVTRFLPSNQKRMPKIYIIHGPREEKHESLITRFSYEYIGRKRYIKPLDAGTWPFKGDGRTLLRLRLAEQFEGIKWEQNNVQELDAHTLINQTALRGKNAVIIQHNLPGEYWNNTTSELLDWYIGEFWKVAVDQLESPHFVIFINVFYSKELEAGFLSRIFSKKYYKEKIVDELKDIALRHSTHCTLLTELQNVNRLHVEDWLISTNLGELDDFAELAEHLFPESTNQPKALVMAKVERFLKKAISNYKQELARRRM